MNTEKILYAMNELDDRYISEAISCKRKVKKTGLVKWGSVAACLSVLIIGGAIYTQYGGNGAPNPDPVQIPNPVITVNNTEEMEKYLDFDVPVLDKEIESCLVIVADSYPAIGQINYADGSEFRVGYGDEDISGIYGGSLVDMKTFDGVEVDYCQYEDITYAIWEEGGFSFSYIYTEDAASDIEALIREFR